MKVHIPRIRQLYEHEGIMLSCIVAAGVLLRIVIFMIDPVLSRDSILYVFLAEKWQESGSFAEVCTFFNSFVKSAYWIPPLFLWLLKILAPLFPSVAVTGVVLNILTGSALIAILYFLVRSLGGEKNVALQEIRVREGWKLAECVVFYLQQKLPDILIIGVKSGAVDVRPVAYIGDGYFVRRLCFKKLKYGVLHQFFCHFYAPVFGHDLSHTFD